MIDKDVSHYRVEEQLGQGGMGIVYRAVDTKLERSVALKFLPPDLSSDPDSKERFMREAKAASGLDHPNICTIHEIGETEDGRLFIAMSYYDGQTLKYLLKGGAMSVAEAASITAQIADGLTKAHAADIVHRDIKPANIMVTTDGRVKILDFGVAKLGEGFDLTKVGSTVGTVSYMSPEQARGEKVDARADLWSLGVLLYEMLSGSRPFDAEYEHAVTYAVLNEDPRPLDASIPDELAAVSKKLLAKNPEDRFATAADVVRALEPWSGQRGSTGTIAAVSKRVNPLAWAAPVGVILIAIVAWLLIGPGRGDNASDVPVADYDIVAILPFSVQAGPELQHLGEGMVTLLSGMLDGAGDIRVTDHNGVIGYVRRQENLVLDPVSGRAIAAEFGANRFILGSILRAGVENRITATLYNVDGTVQEESSASFSSDEAFIPAVDALAAGLIGGLLTNPDEQLGTLAAGTTTSFEALKHYLDAEAALRRAEYQRALDEADAALAIDSTFALAMYVKSSAMGWFTDLQRDSRRLKQVAARYMDGLSQRTKDLVNASIAFDEGRPADAEKIYRRMIAERPNDLEAIGELSETLVHYDNRESRTKEALKLMEELNRFDPDNSQRLMHFADGYAFQGKLSGDYHKLDSLVAFVAGLPIPPNGQRLDWTTALDRLNEDQRRYVAQYALVTGSPEDAAKAAASQRGRPMGLGALQLAWTGHIEEADRLFDVTLEADSALIRYILKSSFAVARGMLGSGELFVDSLRSRVSESLALGFEVLQVTVPTADVEESELASLASQVRNWAPADQRFFEVEGKEETIRQYLLGLLAWRQGDAEALEDAVQHMRSLPSNDETGAYQKMLLSELEGLQFWGVGNLRDAEKAMRNAMPQNEYFLDLGDDIILGRIQPYWFLGEILEDAGRTEEAIDWYSFLSPVDPWRRMAPMWEKMASLYDELGNVDEAIRYYGLFADTWEKADPELQPRVQAARKRIDALLDQKAREPG